MLGTAGLGLRGALAHFATIKIAILWITGCCVLVGWIMECEGKFVLLRKCSRLNAVPFVPHAINISPVCLRKRKYTTEQGRRTF